MPELSEERHKLNKNPITILTDVPEIGEPTTQFEKLADIIKRIIEGSDPEFTIGIYGKWGTGKTTLMRTVQKKFLEKPEKFPEKRSTKILSIFEKIKNFSKIPTSKKNKTENQTNEYQLREIHPTVWFNAWRFEREKAKATIPLMITIIERLLLELDNTADPNLLTKIGCKLISFLRSCEYHLQVTLPGITFDVTKNSSEESSEEQSKVTGIPIPTTQKGLDIIQEMISTLKEKNEKFRMIVFIDDLDRCSYETAIEVFESVKVLLDIKGIVHVIGLSHETVEKLIMEKFKIHGITGEEYIQKIVQLPITIPDWRSEDIEPLIQYNLKEKLGKESDHYQLLENKENLITILAKSNPREAKRIINQFIVHYEFFKLTQPEKGINVKFSIFVISLLRIMSKNDIIHYLSKNDKNSETLKEMLREIAEAEDEDKFKKIIRDWNKENAGEGVKK